MGPPILLRFASASNRQVADDQRRLVDCDDREQTNEVAARGRRGPFVLSTPLKTSVEKARWH